MRIFRTACLLLVCLSLALVSAGQSLGNVAKKERERRDKNKKEGVAAREFSEEEVFGEKEEEKAPEASEGEAGEEPEPSDGPSNEAAVIPGMDQKLEDDGDRFEKESRERKRSEAEWRSKASDARARIAEARERVQFFEELFLPPDGRYVDVNGNTVIESLDHLQRLTREAKEELAAAELDWKQIQDEARRAGIPPGWLR
ncbi:MAG TPA: hypothetical protein VJH87_22360 [Vicinamibacteria bacterium]|nr:hypothetical protein [Vicinamibacteria bacterium]